jgi:hypothetical protein
MELAELALERIVRGACGAEKALREPTFRPNVAALGSVG